MDNLTHTLVGALIGCAVLERRKCSTRPVIAASILANNFPDSDMFYASFFSEPFGYLLHHRGHTHTLVGALMGGVLCFLLVLLVSRMMRIQISSITKQAIFIVSMVGCFAHLALDYLNTYGVHPFWPISNQWIYGDSVFIIEPILWICLSLATFYLVSNIGGKVSLVAAALLGGVLILVSGKVPPKMIMLEAVTFLIIFISIYRTSRTFKSTAWSFCALLVICTFSLAGRVAAKVEQNVESLVSFVSPSPANPFCWTSFQIIETEGDIVYRRQIVEPFQSLVSMNCKNYSLYPDELEERVPRVLLETYSENCRWKAFMKFARVPSLTPCNDSYCTIDLRFSRKGRRRNFSEIPLEGNCPTNLPPWEEPLRNYLP